ncbi:MAG: hypothetical protein AB8B79_04575 [Granulosicoccus sp.]
MVSLTKQPPEHESNAAVVEAELNRLLGERRFASAPQMSAFLKYIVRQTLIGKADRIKAYSVGVDALGKPDTFDAQTDPSVRVLALRLRKTLKAVYASPADNLAVIVLNVGTYVPEFYKSAGTIGSESSKSLDSADSNVGDSIDNELNTIASVRSGTDKLVVIDNRVDVRNIRDVDSAVQHSLKGGLSVKPKNAVKGDSVKRVSHQSLTGVAAIPPYINKWILLMGASVLAILWQLSQVHTSRSGVAISALSILPASVEQPATSGAVLRSKEASTAALPAKPIVFVDFTGEQSDLDRKVKVLLSSSLVRTGSVSVVRRNESWDRQYATHFSGEYQLVVHGTMVENELRFDTQLLNTFSGEMLHAGTIVADGVEQSFSTQNLSAIESVVTGMVRPNGPLYRDFCGRIYQTDCPPS